MKSIVSVILTVIFIVYLAVMLFFTSKERAAMVCSGVVVSVEQEDMAKLLDENDILALVKRNFGKLEGRKILNIETDSIVHLLKRRGPVRDAGAYFSQTGCLHIVVYQHHPLFRVYSNTGDRFAIDESGKAISIEGNIALRTIIVTGNVTKSFASHELRELVRYINGDDLWRAMFEQIHVEKENEILLVPKIGEFKVRLGSLDNLNVKMENFRLYLEQGVEKVGWKSYREINLKYKNQVIGVK